MYRDEVLDDDRPAGAADGVHAVLSAARPARPAGTPAACSARTSSTRSRSSPSPPPSRRPTCWSSCSARAEGTIAALDLPYRTIEICTGDLGQSHHRSFDIEVFSPGAGTWLEVSSISWFSDYQARRANIRFRRSGQKGSDIAHTLNGSALAVPRVWAAILENHRDADGSVAIPEALRPYTAVPRAAPRAKSTDELASRRVQYESAGLDVGDVAADPLAQWRPGTTTRRRRASPSRTR